MKKIIKKESGITLIALVVTIIVLLILAGISIQMLTGQNGILNREGEAKEKSEQANKEEKNILTNMENEILKYDGIFVSSTITKDMYGKTVNYISKTSEENLKWKIFFADRENIYLIASNYVSTIPNKNSYQMTRNKTSKKYYWNESILLQYSETNFINENLFSKNFKYLNENYNKQNLNMKAVGYMLDTDIWEELYGETSNKNVEYVIGGPTLDLLINSYNEKYSESILNFRSSGNGYELKSNNENIWSYFNEGIIDQNDSLYVINMTSDANAMWIASPSAESVDTILSLTFKGFIYTANIQTSKSRAFRPIVCLKSNAKLVKSNNINFDYEIQ